MNFEQFREFLLTKPITLITTHQNPDGDALGSSLALFMVLKKMEIEVSFVLPNAMAKVFDWMPCAEKAIIFDEDRATALSLIKSAELIICLDFNDFARTGLMEGPLRKRKVTTAIIDHHLDLKVNAKFTLSNTKASATAELVYQLLQETALTEHIDSEIATCLYTGILTDTGSFRFPSTSTVTHRCVADLLTYKINHSKIHERIFDSFSENRLKLLGHCLSNQFFLITKHQIVYMYATLIDNEKFQVQKGDTEGIVNYGLSIPDVKMSVFFTETEDLIKISFRSKDDYPANEFAAKYFEGGGHKNAAGGKSKKSLTDTLTYFKKSLDEFENSFL